MPEESNVNLFDSSSTTSVVVCEGVPEFLKILIKLFL